MNVLKPSLKNIKYFVASLKKGRVLVLPTDTVYGLICDATNKKAVNRIYQIKDREKHKFVPIFIKDIKTAKNICFISGSQEKLLKKHWPGRFTFILNRRKSIKKIYGIEKKTIALRIPKNNLIKILLEKINKPLVGTSANISGKPASGKIQDIIEQFKNSKNQPDMFIDGGKLLGKSSKIIDLTGKNPIIIRN